MSVAESPGLFFLDTNILAYSFDATAPEKRWVAQQIIDAALRTQRGIISTQVIQEFLNLALRRFDQPMSSGEAGDYLRVVLLPLCRHYPSANFYHHALLLKDETGYAWYDALVVTAALESGCTTLFTEDMQDGRMVRDVIIRNPFAS